MESTDIVKRIDELLALPIDVGNASLLSQGCVSLLSLVYGPKNVQIENFTSSLAAINKSVGSPGWKGQQIAVASKGALQNLKGEIESGLTGYGCKCPLLRVRANTALPRARCQGWRISGVGQLLDIRANTTEPTLLERDDFPRHQTSALLIC